MPHFNRDTVEFASRERDANCKNYYSLFIEKLVSEPSAVRAWKKSFSELSDWGDCFVNIYSESSPKNKLRQFTFKVVHRIITTKKELLKYKLASDDKCPFCLNPDSIEHTFLYCQESKEFFSKTLRWFNEYHKENVQLSNKQILFNTFNDSLPMQMPNSTQRKFRLLLLLQKKYLYTCTNIVTKPNLEEFLRKLFEQYRIKIVAKHYRICVATDRFFLYIYSNTFLYLL